MKKLILLLALIALVPVKVFALGATTIDVSNSWTSATSTATNMVNARFNQSSGIPKPVWFVSTKGNSKGVIGDPSRVFDVTTATTQCLATNYGTIVFLPGTYANINFPYGKDETNYVLLTALIPHTVDINQYRQPGPGIDAAQVIHNTHIEGLNIHMGAATNPNAWFILGGGDDPATDILFDNCNFEGWSDIFALEFSGQPYGIKFFNCQMLSRWDIFAGDDWSVIPGDTNSFLMLQNCELRFRKEIAVTNYFNGTNVTDNCHVFNTTIAYALQRLIMQNVRIQMDGFPSSVFIAAGSTAYGTGKYVEMNDVTMVVNGDCRITFGMAGSQTFSPLDFINGVRAGNQVAINNFMYVSNGVTRVFNQQNASSKAYCYFGISTTSTPVTANNSVFMVVTNLQFVKVNNFTFDINKGLFTNTTAGWFKFQFHHETTDQNQSGTGETSWFTNGVKMGVSGIDQRDELENINLGSGSGAGFWMSTAPQLFYLGTNTVITLRTMVNKPEGFQERNLEASIEEN